MNAAEHGGGSLKSFYGYKETFNKGTIWVDVPQALTFVHTSNPYEDEDPGGSAAEGDTTFTTEENGRQDEQSNSIEYQLAQAAYPAYATQGLEALSAVASRDQYSYAPPPAPMVQHEPSSHQEQQARLTTSPNGHAAATHNLDYILNHSSASAVSPNIDPRLHSETPAPQSATCRPQQSPEHVRTQSYSPSFGRPSLRAQGFYYGEDRRTAIESPELAFLLRDYCERGGHWMDLFDLNLFFATTVPVLAVRCPLLLYSCAALSAKGLSRVGGRKPVMGGQVSDACRSKMEAWPDSSMSVEDWVHKARQYYDLAVSLLRQALAGAPRPSNASLPEDATPCTIANATGHPLPTTDSDELVAATNILCVYEFLDASGPEWSRHLDGAKTLFDIAKDRMLSLTRPQSPVSLAQQIAQRLDGGRGIKASEDRSSLSKGRKAVFWVFARQDVLSAFINNTSTRLDPSDLALWRNAGLKLTSDGYVCPSNPQHSSYRVEDAMADDGISNAFVWLLAKLVNFIAAGDDMPTEMSPLGLGVRQQELLEYWDGLDAQFTAWYEGLPNSFHATAVCLSEDSSSIEEKWFPRPMCASTMQWWHFARIQLLHNKPHVSTAAPLFRNRPSLGRTAPGVSLAARHASYVSILQQSRDHAKDIVAIGLGRSDEGTRVHSVQPLWTAGLVLGLPEDGNVSEETTMWRRNIVLQLRGIERDMGWASEYRVRELLELWKLPPDWGLDLPT